MTYEEYSIKRDKLGLTDYAVSALTRVSKATLSQWKNGNTKPSQNTLQRLNYLLNHYDPNESYPENYFVLGSPAVKAHAPADKIPPSASGAIRFEPQADIYKQPPLRIDGYYVNILRDMPIELSEKDYKELKKATEAYALAWLQTHGKIN